MNPLIQNKTLIMLRGPAGLRCRAKLQIRTHAGNVQLSTEGIVVSEIDNLSRHLIEVRWDEGFCAYVFPNEIEILSDGCPQDLAAGSA